MLPLTLITAAKGQAMLIELKNGDTYNGRLVQCNMFMNILLKDVIRTTKVPTCAGICVCGCISEDFFCFLNRMVTGFSKCQSAIYTETRSNIFDCPKK